MADEINLNMEIDRLEELQTEVEGDRAQAKLRSWKALGELMALHLDKGNTKQAVGEACRLLLLLAIDIAETKLPPEDE